MLFPFKTKPALNLDLTQGTVVTVGDSVIGQVEIPVYGFLTVNESIAISKDWKYLNSIDKAPTCRAEQVFHESYIFLRSRLDCPDLTRDDYAVQFPYKLMEAIHEVFEKELKAAGDDVYQIPDGSGVNSDFLSPSLTDGLISSGNASPSIPVTEILLQIDSAVAPSP